MKKIFRIMLVGAVAYFLPLTVVMILLVKILQVADKLATPLARLVPVESVAGVGIASILSVLLLMGACYLAGLLSQRPNWGFVRKLEDTVLIYIPGYSILQSWARGMAGLQSDKGMAVILARIEDAWQLAFLMETQENGVHTVMVPEAPSPFSGAIYFLPEERIRRVPITTAQAIRCVRRFGLGSKEIFKEHAHLLK